VALKKDYRVRENPDETGYFVEAWDVDAERWRCVAHRQWRWSARRLAARLAQNRPPYVEVFYGSERQ
jgi:hypothetical protein